jgi:hypothetical protein
VEEKGEMNRLGEANCRVAGNGLLPKGKEDLGFIQIPRGWALRLQGVMLLKDRD